MKAHYIMLGGFLGAGKTTLLIALAQHLQAQGKRVGLITNDQASGLADTAIMRSHHLPVEEIAGGCFCCRFNSLKQAADQLQDDLRPDIFLAEPVGSCTDLVATVSYPLKRMYGDQYHIAPFSVLVDPRRALKMFGLSQGKAFSDKVRYLYERQLEEAEAIVINKTDTLSIDQRKQLEDAFLQRHPHKTYFWLSAKEQLDLAPWFDWVLREEQAKGASMEIDYQLYGEAEAELAWLNATLDVQSEQDLDGNTFLQTANDALCKMILDQNCEIAHLKMTLAPRDGSGEMASIQKTDNETPAQIGLEMMDPFRDAEWIINFRAFAKPEELETMVQSLSQSSLKLGVHISLQHLDAFRPAQPVPTYRET